MPTSEIVNTYASQFDRLVEEILPVLHVHFLRQGIKSSMYCSQWFLTMFSYKCVYSRMRLHDLTDDMQIPTRRRLPDIRQCLGQRHRSAFLVQPHTTVQERRDAVGHEIRSAARVPEHSYARDLSSGHSLSWCNSQAY